MTSWWLFQDLPFLCLSPSDMPTAIADDPWIWRPGWAFTGLPWQLVCDLLLWWDPPPLLGYHNWKWVLIHLPFVCLVLPQLSLSPECFSLPSALVRACKALNQGIGESILGMYVHTYVAVMLRNVDECSTYGFPACGYLHAGFQLAARVLFTMRTTQGIQPWRSVDECTMVNSEHLTS